MKGMERAIAELEKLGCGYEAGYPMSRYTTMRIGGTADLVVFPGTPAQLTGALDMLSGLGIEWIALGGGSNVILPEHMHKAVVSTKRVKGFEILEGGAVEMEAGAMLSAAMNTSIQAELTGLEFAAGIPGTAGGAVVMNAGANEGEMKDIVECVWVWHEGAEIALTPTELGFSYRSGLIPPGSVVTRVRVRLRPGNREKSERMVREHIKRRNETQPVDMANSGSIFKNPPTIAAGALLEELGYKGHARGGARFSELHANFIVNTGGASPGDIIGLIEEARGAALSRRGIRLETEVRIIQEDG